MRDRPRHLRAGNTGPFTLDGTRTYIVGSDVVAIIDPGPDVENHVRALAFEVESAASVAIVLTHEHADHAGGAGSLAAALGSRASVSGPRGMPGLDVELDDGDSVETDEGALVAVHTPGHTRKHHCYHWPDRRALFAGDLLLGRGDTTWVAEYPGCVADYLVSLDRLRGLDLEVIYPAHGDPLDDPAEALDRFERHRRERIEQVRAALERHPDADVVRLLEAVYGDTLPRGMEGAALRSLSALLEYVNDPETP